MQVRFDLPVFTCVAQAEIAIGDRRSAVNQSWINWPKEIRMHNLKAIKNFEKQNYTDIEFHQFLNR